MLYILLMAVLLLLLAYWLLRQGKVQQQISGLPRGEVIYSDTSTWQPLERPLLSRRYGIVGKPDYVVAADVGGNGVMVPIEVKSGDAQQPPPVGHLLQLGAYCLLVEEHYGITPAYGLLHYADDTLRIPFTEQLRSEVLAVAAEIRRAQGARKIPRNHDSIARCRACGYRHACGDEALT